MNIIVCIKQVPDTTDIKWTKNNTLKRDEMDSVINPFDEYAIETALQIKEKVKDTTITAISMGPKQSREALKNALAVGCDNAVLICDKKFAGADTVATANTIASAIRNNLDFDLIICGQFATDGDTAQTGPGIAENLKIPQITYVQKIIEANNEYIIAEKESDYGIETIKVQLPALICIQKCETELRQAKINGYIYAQEKEIKEISLDNLDINEDKIGIKGSPTYVNKAYRPEIKRNTQFVSSNDLIQIIKEKGGIND